MKKKPAGKREVNGKRLQTEFKVLCVACLPSATPSSEEDIKMTTWTQRDGHNIKENFVLIIGRHH